MSSTRNNNTPGNFASEQWAKNRIADNLSFLNQPNGQAITSHLPGDGLLVGTMGPRVLAHNYADIDSFLKGIGSTNLISPLPELVPEYRTLDSLSIMNKLPVYMPRPLRVDLYQRPLPS